MCASLTWHGEDLCSQQICSFVPDSVAAVVSRQPPGHEGLWAVRWLFKAPNWLPVILKLTRNRQAVMSCHLQHLAKCPTVPVELTYGICADLCVGVCVLTHLWMCVCVGVCVCKNVSLRNRWHQLLEFVTQTQNKSCRYFWMLACVWLLPYSLCCRATLCVCVCVCVCVWSAIWTDHCAHGPQQMWSEQWAG